MLKLKQYDVTIPKLIEIILKMTPEERSWLLQEAQQRKVKMRAIRRNCCVAILLYYEERIYPATITNLSFTGAFVECYIPVRIGDSVSVEFNDLPGTERIKLKARIIHATNMGFGIRYNTVKSNAARFLQKCLDDFKPDDLV
jgi:hypothetical protein